LIGELSTAIQGALGKIDFLPALFAFMFFFKFIRKNFFRKTAARALATERLQMLELLKSGTMLGGCHDRLLNLPEQSSCFFDDYWVKDTKTCDNSPVTEKEMKANWNRIQTKRYFEPILGSIPLSTQSGV